MNSWRGWYSNSPSLLPLVAASPLGDGAFGIAAQFPVKPESFPLRQRLPPRGSWLCEAKTEGVSSQKQKSGHAGGQAARPVFVFFASAVVPNTAGAAQGAAEQTVLPLPVEKRKKWRNGAERLQTLLFSGATWLELANHRCENRIPQSVSLVNP